LTRASCVCGAIRTHLLAPRGQPLAPDQRRLVDYPILTFPDVPEILIDLVGRLQEPPLE
jgi:hypothetical protein